MMKEKLEKYFGTETWIVCGICVLVSVIAGLISKPFLLHFTDGLTISGMACVVFWLLGNWRSNLWRAKNVQEVDELYEEQKKRSEEKKNSPALLAGGLLTAFVSLLIALIMF